MICAQLVSGLSYLKVPMITFKMKMTRRKEKEVVGHSCVCTHSSSPILSDRTSFGSPSHSSHLLCLGVLLPVVAPYLLLLATTIILLDVYTYTVAEILVNFSKQYTIEIQTVPSIIALTEYLWNR